ncbi:YeeE/YedE family protein [bacterium]|nr:YeeE/YedE family protein [bacterium]
MAPFQLQTLLGYWGMMTVYFLLGLGFGFALEMSGFGKSTKLAAQFYFKELTVLKVMFTAIITAMVLIFLSSSLGLLDYSRVYVNTTYLWPGIVGGLIMGVGFIIGGFCPGTSLVGMATFKIDGLFFVLGGLFGIFLFGETVSLFSTFWNSSFYGRLTLFDFLGVPAGMVVVGVVLMAIAMFWGGEHLERIFGGRDLKKEPTWRYAAAAALLLLALFTAFIGQPSLEQKWQKLGKQKQRVLEARDVYIEPAEMLSLMHDDTRGLVIWDVRSERDFNLFHLRSAVRMDEKTLRTISGSGIDPAANQVIVIVGNDETAATRAWKLVVLQDIPNVYILSGGINRWLQTFAAESGTVLPKEGADDELRFTFRAALGARQPAAEPEEHLLKTLGAFTPKVKMTKVVKRQGGCG